MNPASFQVDSQVLFDVLITIIVLSFLVERALSLVFEHRWFVARYSEKGVKEPISFLLSFAVVRYWGFDALGVLLQSGAASVWGYIVTAAIIAGGSKGSIKLFHDVFKTMSSAEKERQALKKTKP